MLLSGAYDNVSDADLDSMYANTYAAVKRLTGAQRAQAQSTLSTISSEILMRVGGLTGFARGFLNMPAFPKFEAIQKETGGFVSTDAARAAVRESAKNVVTTATSTISNTLKWGVVGVAGVGLTLLTILILTRRK